MIRRLAISFALLTILATTTYSQTLKAKNPTLVGGDIIVYIDATKNSGSTQIHLHNDTEESMGILLNADDFTLQTTQQKVSGKVLFQQADSQRKESFLKADLGKDESLLVLLEITDFGEAGEAHAHLKNDREIITTIKAVKFNVPFKVSLDAANPINPKLTFQRGKTGTLVFKNEDPMTYPVEWSLMLSDSGSVFDPSTIILPGRSTKHEELLPRSKAFVSWFHDLFKYREQDGRLVLKFNPSGDVGCPVPPTKTIPVKLEMRYWSSGMQSFTSNAAILVFLILGGICSLFLSLWIPNKLQRMDLLRRIEKLARKTRTISNKIDSSLRVGVRVERLRLAEIIRSMRLFNTDASIIFEGYKGDINLLDRRVNLIQDLDAATRILESHRAKIADAPAKILDDVGKQLENATELLKLSAPEENDFQRVQETIRSASERLNKITIENPQLAEKLAKWITDLKDNYDENNGQIGKQKKCKELCLELKELFNVFDTKDYTDKSKILPVHYHWLSSTVERLFVLRHYIRAWKNSSKDRQARMKTHEEELLKNLRIRTWNALHHARRLRIEIEEDIFSDDVEKALAEENVSISTVPIQPQSNQPVRMKVEFNQADLNTCMARHEFSCEWNFGPAVGTELGWEISHYFRNRKEDETKFTVSFRGPDGKKVEKEINGGNTKEVKISGDIQLQPTGKKQYGERAKIELIQLGVALVIAVLGLIAGAREQLMKLDLFSGLVGVFLIGFGADTVKNLITKKSQGET